MNLIFLVSWIWDAPEWAAFYCLAVQKSKKETRKTVSRLFMLCCSCLIIFKLRITSVRKYYLFLYICVFKDRINLDLNFDRSCIIFRSLQKHSRNRDTTLWKSQWGHSAVFRRGTNDSAGVTILLNKLCNYDAFMNKNVAFVKRQPPTLVTNIPTSHT